MARNDWQFCPILQIRSPLGEPSHAPFALFMTGDDRYDEARRAGGIRNVTRYKLDKDPVSYFDEDEADKAAKNRGLSLPYSLPAQDELNSLQAWETVPTDEEKEQLDAARTKYAALRDELIAAELENPLTPERADLLRDYRTIVAACELNTSIISHQLGFLQVIPGIFGYGGHSMHDFNGVPNVNKARQSTFTLKPDKPFHIAFQFAKPLPEQRETDFAMIWGPFTLRLRGGRRALLSCIAAKYYKPGGGIDYEAIAAKQKRLEFLLDQGRLTADDMVYIDGLKAQIRGIEKTVRDQHLKHSDPAYLPFYRQIEDLKGKISERQKLKRQAPGASLSEAAKIKKDLYQIYEHTVNLNESQENFYGPEGILRLTVLPQRRGFLTLVLNGGEPVTIKIPNILKTRQYGSLWDETRIAFTSNGGAFDWQFLYVNAESSGEFRLPSVAVPFAIGGDEPVYFIADKDDALPGCDIAISYEESDDSTAQQRRYDFIAKFRSDVGVKEDAANVDDVKNEYLPWLYSLRIWINAGKVPENTTIFFDTTEYGVTKSTNWANPNPRDDNPIMDVSMTADESSDGWRGAQMTVLLMDPNGTLNFPRDGFKRHLVDFKVGMWKPGVGAIQGVQPYIVNGVILSAELLNSANAGDATQIAGPGSMWRLTIGDVFSLLEDYEIRDEIILDGLTLGEALKRLFGMRGLSDATLAGIPTVGAAAGPVLPLPGVGEKPRKSPSIGTRLQSYARQLLSDFGVTEDDEELRLYAPNGVITMDVPSAGPSFGWSSAESNELKDSIKYGSSRVSDWSRFWNDYLVQGGKDPETGKKLEARHPLIASQKTPGHPLYLGEPRTMPVSHRPDLTTQADVERAVEILVVRNAKSGDMSPVERLWMYPMRWPGDHGTADGKTMEIVSVRGMSLKGASSAHVILRPVVNPFL